MLQVENLSVSFKKEHQRTLFGKERQQVLKNISLELREGECLGLIGESGSGKSTLGRVICGLLKPNSGRVTFRGIDLYGRHNAQEKAQLRHRISVVFQDYSSSVNPRFSIAKALEETLRLRQEAKGRQLRDQAAELLERVGLESSFLSRYPHELSGGQLQRVCIARAVALEPEIIIFDEAVSSLDSSTQVQIMDLLKDLRGRHRFTYLFITHDLTAVTYLCDRVLFLYRGDMVEQVDSMDQLPHITSDYAKKLLRSVMGLELRGDSA